MGWVEFLVVLGTGPRLAPIGSGWPLAYQVEDAGEAR